MARLLEAHGDRIYGLGLRMCGNEAAAEDLVQETFLRALRSWDSFEGRSRPSTWLYTIASRACRRMKRRRSGEPTRIESLEELLPGAGEEIPDLPPGDEGPLDEVLRRELRDRVQEALEALPPDYRLPLVLKEMIGLSVAEVAEILGLKEGTVKTRLHRARLAARKQLRRALPAAAASPPDHSRRECLDLLRAKQEALDRDASFPVTDEYLCSRCRSLFETLDLTREACRRLAKQDELPTRLRQAVLEEIA